MGSAKFSFTGRAAAPALMFAALTLAGCGGLTPEGRFRDDPLGDFEQRIIGNALAGVGIVERPRERIDYSPRAPLAMPPRGGRNGELPPPREEAGIGNNPNWPRDPDTMRRMQADAERRRPNDTQFERERDGRRLTIEEMEEQRRLGPQVAGRNDPNDRFRDSNVVLGREDLERGWTAPSPGGIFAPDETVDVTQGRGEGQGAARREIDRQAGGGPNPLPRGADQRIDTTRLSQAEPERRTITDPPPGFRAPAPDPTGGVVRPEEDRRGWWERLWGR